MMLRVSQRELRRNCYKIVNIGYCASNNFTLFRLIKPVYYVTGKYGKNMEVFPSVCGIAFVQGYRPIYDYCIDELPGALEELKRIDAILDAIEDAERLTKEAFYWFINFQSFCRCAIYEKGLKK